MENYNELFGLIIAVLVVIIVISLQIYSFVMTRKKIIELRHLFDEVDNLYLKETCISPNELRSKSSLQHFLENIPNRQISINNSDDGQLDSTNLSLLALSGGKQLNDRFGMIIFRTNEYLCKNTGTSADLGILEAICDNQKNNLEEDVHNSLNVPLYLGLAGTFIGIITGLVGVDFQAMFGSSITNLSGLQHLLYGVVVAMLASLLGLSFTIYNSAVSYKSAVARSNEGKDEYMDFLRRELMPLLSNSMASSLSSLRSVLSHFVDKFGRNLDAYADSADLLNDNLEKQHLVLQEINNLSLTNTATKIAETFAQLKDSAESFEIFKEYQDHLNATIANMASAANQIQTLIHNFSDFNLGLSVVVNNQNRTTELQQEFKQAITTHFPIGSEARDVWRKEYDLLMSDGEKVSKEISDQLKASTQYIQNFVNNNNDFFLTFDKMKDVLDTMVQYTKVQADCYKDMKDEITNLRKEYKDAQIESVELHKATINAVNEMNKLIKESNKF